MSAISSKRRPRLSCVSAMAPDAPDSSTDSEMSPLPRFSADDLIDCYRRGVFPMADARHDERLFLVDPPQRGIIPLDAFHVSHRLARTARSPRFTVSTDTAFAEVIGACAAPRQG